MVKGHFKCFDNLSKKGCFNEQDDRQKCSGVHSCIDSKTQSETAANNPEMTVCLFPEAAERAVSVLKAVV